MILFVMAVKANWPLANSREQQEIVTLSVQLLRNCLMLSEDGLSYVFSEI